MTRDGRSLTTVFALALVASLVGAVAPADADTVHTDTSKVHACQPLAGLVSGPLSGSVLAATDGGLVFFDHQGGVHQAYTSLDGLAGTRSYTFLVEGETLWVGGERGLARARVVEGRLEVVASHPGKPVRALVRHQGTLYAGTWGTGLMRISRGVLEPVVASSGADTSTDLRITALAVHRDALIVATSGQGVYRLDGGRLRPMNVAGLGSHSVVWSLIDHEDRLLAGTVNGLFALDGDRAEKLADGDMRGLTARHGEVVVARFGRGLATLGPNGLDNEGQGPAGGRFAYGYGVGHALAEHHPATVECVASHDGIWLRAPGTPGWHGALVETVPSGDISAAAVAGETLWIGTFDSGLAALRNGRWQRYEHPRIDPKINALVVAHGQLWVGTSGGLSTVASDRVTRVDKRDGLPSSVVLSLAPLAGGGMLVGTAHGAAVVRDGAITVIGRKQGVYIGNVWAVHEDRQGRLLLGTTKGLYRVAEDMSFERFSVASGHLRDDWVMAIERTGDTLWIGTYKGGVSRLDPSPGATATATDGGFSATQLGGGFINPHGLTWHDGRLHAATMDGYLVGDGERWDGPEEPAPGRDTTAVVIQGDGADRTLWIASRRGLRGIAGATRSERQE